MAVNHVIGDTLNCVVGTLQYSGPAGTLWLRPSVLQGVTVIYSAAPQALSVPQNLQPAAVNANLNFAVLPTVPLVNILAQLADGRVDVATDQAMSQLLGSFAFAAAYNLTSPVQANFTPFSLQAAVNQPSGQHVVNGLFAWQRAANWPQAGIEIMDISTADGTFSNPNNYTPFTVSTLGVLATGQVAQTTVALQLAFSTQYWWRVRATVNGVTYVSAVATFTTGVDQTPGNPVVTNLTASFT